MRGGRGWVEREDDEEENPRLEELIVRDSSSDEKSSILPRNLKEDTFAIVPYWEWHDVKNDNLPFTVVKILEVKEDGTAKVRRYGNIDGELLGPQKTGWFDKVSKKIDYIQKQKRNYIEYTNFINTPKYKSEHVFYPHSFLVHGFELTNRKTIPIYVLKILARNEWLTSFKPNPFIFQE